MAKAKATRAEFGAYINGQLVGIYVGERRRVYSWARRAYPDALILERPQDNRP